MESGDFEEEEEEDDTGFNQFVKVFVPGSFI